jgi:hypothetical protein
MSYRLVAPIDRKSSIDLGLLAPLTKPFSCLCWRIFQLNGNHVTVLKRAVRKQLHIHRFGQPPVFDQRRKQIDGKTLT